MNIKSIQKIYGHKRSIIIKTKHIEGFKINVDKLQNLY